MKSSLLKILIFSISTLGLTHIEAKSQEAAPPVCPTNPINLAAVGGFCVLTPERYGVKIYEMGLCTSNPLSNNNFSKASCFTSLSNSSPATTDMATGETFNLSSQNPIDGRPKSGAYTHAYIIISPEFELKFTYKINNINYYSSGVNSSASNPIDNASTEAPSKSFIETLNDFGDDEEGFSPSAQAMVSGGSISALLTDSDLNTSTAAAETQRLIGVFTPDNPIRITGETSGLEVNFIVTNQGGGLEACEGAIDQVCNYGSGPFSAKFTPF
tara:strand:- start:272 stop:1084 length:813 start_codon:yes stop_codon:yes gene_type:complete